MFRAIKKIYEMKKITVLVFSLLLKKEHTGYLQIPDIQIKRRRCQNNGIHTIEKAAMAG